MLPTKRYVLGSNGRCLNQPHLHWCSWISRRRSVKRGNYTLHSLHIPSTFCKFLKERFSGKAFPWKEGNGLCSSKLMAEMDLFVGMWGFSAFTGRRKHSDYFLFGNIGLSSCSFRHETRQVDLFMLYVSIALYLTFLTIQNIRPKPFLTFYWSTYQNELFLMDLLSLTFQWAWFVLLKNNGTWIWIIKALRGLCWISKKKFLHSFFSLPLGRKNKLRHDLMRNLVLSLIHLNIFFKH